MFSHCRIRAAISTWKGCELNERGLCGIITSAIMLACMLPPNQLVRCWPASNSGEWIAARLHILTLFVSQYLGELVYLFFNYVCLNLKLDL